MTDERVYYKCYRAFKRSDISSWLYYIKDYVSTTELIQHMRYSLMVYDENPEFEITELKSRTDVPIELKLYVLLLTAS